MENAGFWPLKSYVKQVGKLETPQNLEKDIGL